MFRPSRILAVLICLSAFALFTAPASAQPQGPLVLNPAMTIKTVTVMGAGETLEEAEENALTEIRATYFVLSYSTSNELCNPLFGTSAVANQSEDPPTNFCSIVVTARVLRKALWLID